MPTLLETQRRFSNALGERLVGEDRLLGGLARGRSEVSEHFAETARGLLRATPRLGADERLGLYQRQYWYRLLDSLAEDFPSLQTLLGRETLFTELEHYIAACPPGSWDLRLFGARLAAFVARSPRLPQDTRRLAAALARRDFAFMEVFDAPRLPEPIDADLEGAELRLQPCVRLLVLHAPVQAWLDDPNSGYAVRPRRRMRELHVVWRARDNRICATHEPLSLLPVLRELERGGTLGRLLGRCRNLPGARTLREAFMRWRAGGLLALAGEPSPRRAAP